jgi:methionyl-tRNA formyltransferase
MQPPPVKRAAIAHALPVTQPERIKTNPEFREQLEAIAPDAILVVAYGRIIPRWMLDLPRFGNINLHGSLLPKYRGAAPIQWAVANGETTTGVTTMRLDEDLDTGDMLLAHAVPIAPQETALDLFHSLAETGANLMVETLAKLDCGLITPQPQDHSMATIAPILTREDGRINFARDAKQIYDRWRGFQPWPGAYTSLRGKKLIVHRMSIAPRTSFLSSAPTVGEIAIVGDALHVACGSGAIVLQEVQVEGKKRMAAAEFLRGFQLHSGERLGA